MSTSLESAISRLIMSQNMFYATIMQNCRRVYTNKVPSLGVSVTDQINLYVNTEWFDAKTPKQQEDVLKHECLHLILNHCTLSKDRMDFEKLDHKQKNIAMDCTINQMEGIEKSVEEIGGVTLARFRQACAKFVDPATIQANQSFDYYANVISKCQEKFDEQMAGENFDDHGVWEESEGKDISQAYKEHVVKQVAKKAQNAAGGAGNMSSQLSVLLDKLFASRINWKSELRKFVNNAVNFTRTGSRRKRNRRYGTMFAGKKKEWEMHLAFLLDTSGSMSDEYLAQGWSEMAKLQQFYPNMQITLIECDSDVKNVREFNPKLKPEICGRGGTVMTPGFKKAEELEADIIVCFTDGDFYEDLPKSKIPTLWTVIGKHSWDLIPWGRKIFINELGT